MQEEEIDSFRERCDVEYETKFFEKMVAFGSQTAEEVRQEILREELDQIKQYEDGKWLITNLA